MAAKARTHGSKSMFGTESKSQSTTLDIINPPKNEEKVMIQKHPVTVKVRTHGSPDTQKAIPIPFVLSAAKTLHYLL